MVSAKFFSLSNRYRNLSPNLRKIMLIRKASDQYYSFSIKGDSSNDS
jgi:hypothetical protein